MGLIGPMSPAALQTLLIVQPEVEADASSLYSEEDLLPQTGAFHLRAVSLHCHLQSSSIEIVACYDRKDIPEDENLQVLSLFEMLFPQVCHEPEILVGQPNGSVAGG